MGEYVHSQFIDNIDLNDWYIIGGVFPEHNNMPQASFLGSQYIGGELKVPFLTDTGKRNYCSHFDISVEVNGVAANDNIKSSNINGFNYGLNAHSYQITDGLIIIIDSEVGEPSPVGTRHFLCRSFTPSSLAVSPVVFRGVVIDPHRLKNFEGDIDIKTRIQFYGTNSNFQVWRGINNQIIKDTSVVYDLTLRMSYREQPRATCTIDAPTVVDDKVGVGVSKFNKNDKMPFGRATIRLNCSGYRVFTQGEQNYPIVLATLTDANNQGNTSEILTVDQQVANAAKGVGLKLYPRGSDTAVKYAPPSLLKGSLNQIKVNQNDYYTNFMNVKDSLITHYNTDGSTYHDNWQDPLMVRPFQKEGGTVKHIQRGEANPVLDLDVFYVKTGKEPVTAGVVKADLIYTFSYH